MKTRRHFLRPLLGIAIVLLLLGAAPVVYASGAECGLTAISASKKGKGIDPKLKGIKELTTPPFSTTYSRFDFLGHDKTMLKVGSEEIITLTPKHTVKLTYNGKSGKKLKFHIELPSVVNADVSMKDGAYFFTATSSGFLLGVKCKATP